jgi:hypothetical protein
MRQLQEFQSEFITDQSTQQLDHRFSPRNETRRHGGLAVVVSTFGNSANGNRWRRHEADTLEGWMSFCGPA